ncbi:MAG: HDIG domain-containing protein [Theionarchaea archaeon]|nr:HDIG domain-containing protein [Theionarchaea archaeon]
MKRDEALALLREVGCPENVVDHCICVSEKATSMACCAQKETEITIPLVTIGGLLHDIGRSITHSIRHGVVGARLLKQHGVCTPLQLICERHVCAGIPKEVAEKIGLGSKDYIPLSLEEKIVCHADNLTNHTVDELRTRWKSFFDKESGEIIVSLLEQLDAELQNYVQCD